MPSVHNIQAVKIALRKCMQKKLSALSREEKKRQSDKVLKMLFALPVFQKSKRVSVYLSTDYEVSTVPILKYIFENGKSCFVPRYSKNDMEMVLLRSMKDWETLPMTKWNIKQPDLIEYRENAFDGGGLDLLIVPGTAFTPEGDRMGHGKGFYDMFLTKLKKQQSHAAATVALAYKEQVLSEIPLEDHDVKIDLILYDDSSDNANL
ncbi:hypothetical protein FQR65_LT03260 [Abscondita terminalis]|nr:hypothetical protein FQR65_LT03260 [Abscondita terminalis]